MSTDQQLEQLYRLTVALGTTLDLAHETATFVAWLAEAVKPKLAALFVADEEKQALQLLGAHGFDPPTCRYLPMGLDPWRWLTEQGITVPDAEDPRRYTLPISLSGELLGMLCLVSGRSEDQLAPEQQLVGIAVGYLAPVLRNIWRHQMLERQVAKRTAELSMLYRVALAAISAPNLDTLLEQVVKTVSATLYPANFGFLLLDPEMQTLRPHPSYHGVPPEALEVAVPLGKGVSGRVAQTGEPLLVPDVTQFEGYLEVMPGVRSEVCVPLRVDKQILGVINAESRRPNAFNESDLRLLSTLAGQLATAIERVRLFEQVKQRAEEMTALYEVSLHLATAGELDQLLQAVIRQVAVLLNVEDVGVHLYDPTADELGWVIACGLGERYIGLRLKPGEGLAGKAMQARRPMVVDNYQVWEGRSPRFAGLGIAAVAAVPLLWQDQLVGVLVVAHRQKDQTFNEHDVHLLTLLAQLAGGAIANAQLLGEARRRAAETAALLATTRAISTLDQEMVLETIAREAKRLFKADGSRIHLIEPDGETLRCVIALHQRAEAALKLRLKLGQGIAGHVALSGEPELIDQTLADPRGMQIPGTPVEPESMALAPLKVRDQVIGVMTVTRLGEDRPFTPADLTLLTAFADQAAIALENARLFEAERRHARELAAVAQVSSALRAASTRSEMLPIILDQLLDLLQADGAAAVMHDPVTGELIVELARGAWTTITGERTPASVGIVRHVMTTGQLYLTDDVYTDPQISHPELFGDIQAAACAPLITHDEQAIGALWVGRHTPISEEEARLLTAIADMAANAIHRATLHEQTEQRLQRLLALRSIDEALTTTTDMRVALNVILNQVITQLGVDATAVLLFNPHTRALEHVANQGFRGSEITQSQVRLGEGYAGRAALEGCLIRVSDLTAVNDFERAQLLRDEAFVFYAASPLVAKGELKGVLEVFHRSPLTPDPEWIDFLETLARQAAIAIDNAQLFENLQRSYLNLKLTYDITLEGWARALALRDIETEEHTRRVTELTARLAQVMGIEGEELAHIRYGALLHDIGKIGIPDRILLKPDELTAEERELVQQHPVYAHQLLSPIVYLHRALDIPYCHHERWDGTGYPRGLKGEEIPLAARIFAVVDVYDALRSDRPYRKAWPEEKVREYIRAQAGKHFDPQVVEAFFRMMENEA